MSLLDIMYIIISTLQGDYQMKNSLPLLITDMAIDMCYHAVFRKFIIRSK